MEKYKGYPQAHDEIPTEAGLVDLLIVQTSPACPVQYEGLVNGRPFYFRARHDEWTFTIADTIDEAVDGYSENGTVFDRGGTYGKKYDASWMPHPEAERIIRQYAIEYVTGQGRQE